MNRQDDQRRLLYEFGSHLRQLRVERNLTQEELAAQAGFSRSYYGEIEAGKRNVALLNLYKLAQCLNLSLSEVVDIK